MSVLRSVFLIRSIVSVPENAYGTLDMRLKRSEEHTSELQSLSAISYAVFCLAMTLASENVDGGLEKAGVMTEKTSATTASSFFIGQLK